MLTIDLCYEKLYWEDMDMRNRQVQKGGGGNKASSLTSVMGILLEKLKLNNQELVSMLFNNIQVISLKCQLGKN